MDYTINIDKDNGTRIRDVAWFCSNWNSDNNHLMKHDEVYICEDLQFEHKDLFSHVIEILCIPKFTKCFVTQVYEYAHKFYADVTTVEGARLKYVPYHLLEFYEYCEEEKLRESVEK